MKKLCKKVCLMHVKLRNAHSASMFGAVLKFDIFHCTGSDTLKWYNLTTMKLLADVNHEFFDVAQQYIQ